MCSGDDVRERADTYTFVRRDSQREEKTEGYLRSASGVKYGHVNSMFFAPSFSCTEFALRRRFLLRNANSPDSWVIEAIHCNIKALLLQI